MGIVGLWDTDIVDLWVTGIVGLWAKGIVLLWITCIVSEEWKRGEGVYICSQASHWEGF